MSASSAYAQMANGHGHANGYGHHHTNGHTALVAAGQLQSSHPIVVSASSYSASPTTTVTIDVAAMMPHRSTNAQSRPSHAADSSDEDDLLDPELTSMMSSEDARLFASLPPPGRAGRLKPRSRSLARFYYHLNRCIDYLPHVLDLLMRGLGPALVLVAWLLFASCAHVFFASIVPVHGWSVFTWPGAFIIPYGLFLLAQVYYNHVMAVYSKPGGVPKEWTIPTDIRELIREESASHVRGEGFTKYCKTCIHPKAQRMHHCHVCQTCVLRMDHRQSRSTFDAEPRRDEQLQWACGSASMRSHRAPCCFFPLQTVLGSVVVWAIVIIVTFTIFSSGSKSAASSSSRARYRSSPGRMKFNSFDSTRSMWMRCSRRMRRRSSSFSC
jgi:hypothetical protein